MTQKMPRNQALHERRHHRKAGPHASKKVLREALWAILRSNAECGEIHHSRAERHEYGEECPVLKRIDAAVDGLRHVLHEGEERK